MKTIAFGLLAIATIAQTAVVPLQTVNTVVPVASTTLVRTPSLDSAVINSERLDSAFRYETVENHAYTPVVYSSVPSWNVVPQYPFVYSHIPSTYPVYNIVPGYNPGYVVPGSSQTPITEVEDPADNASNDLKVEPQNSNKDDDTVEVESV